MTKQYSEEEVIAIVTAVRKQIADAIAELRPVDRYESFRSLRKRAAAIAFSDKEG